MRNEGAPAKQKFFYFFLLSKKGLYDFPACAMDTYLAYLPNKNSNFLPFKEKGGLI